MKSFRFLVLGIALAAAVLVIFFSRTALVRFFQNLRFSILGAADSNFSYESYQNLKTQNAILTENAANGNNPVPAIASGRYHYRPARVFSDYPFNNYASLIVDLGSDDGMKSGMPVLSADGVLLGKITEVKRTQSEVETIFDPNWKSAVTFGTGRFKALLTGGPAPYLDLIPKEASAVVGDSVLNLASDFPMNLLVGKILSWESGENNIWFKAKLAPPVRFENLGKVMVVVDFP